MEIDNDTTFGDEDLSNELSIIIPAFNEEEGIIPTLKGLIDEFPKAEIIVVDDCSSDATGERAIEAGVQVIRNEFNRGYGGSLKVGMRSATRHYIAWFDADNEHRSSDLKGMVHKLHNDHLAAVIGSRIRRGKSTMRTVGKWMIRLIARVLSVQLGPDINCGLRVFRASVIIPNLEVLPEKYSASVTSTMILAEKGFPIAFHPVDLNNRLGESKVRMMHGFETMALILRVVTLFAPLRIFLRTGLFMVGFGLIYGLYTAVTMERGIPGSSVVLILVGVLFSLLGLIADQISQIRLNQLTK